MAGRAGGRESSLTERYSAAVDRSLRLRDGRQLGFATFGDADGAPVLYFHGHVSSRLEGRLAHVAGLRHGICVIALDRPGFGLSDARPGMRIADAADDVAEAADHLGIERFSLLGATSGSPFALACAARLRERVRAVAVISSPAQHDRPGALAGMDLRARLYLHHLPRWAPWILQRIHERAARLSDRDPGELLRLVSRSIARSEQRAFQSPEVTEVFMDAAYEAFRSGPGAMVQELRLLARPWGFDLSAIAAPVFLWHGATDTGSPVAMAHALAHEIPKCRAQIIAERGSVIAADVMPEAIATLAAQARDE